MNSQTRLRKVYLHDRASFQEIARAAYYQNYFDHWNTKAGVDQYIEEQFGTARLQIELVDPTIEYNFIEYKGEVVGFTKLNLSPKSIDLPSGLCELEKIYLLPKYIGKGIAKQALSSVLHHAKAAGKTAVYLYVIDTNTNAIAFYRSFGFEMESKTQFNAPDFKEELRGLFKMRLALGEGISSQLSSNMLK